MAKFEEVYGINVNDKTEKKNNLTYLSWCYAWAEMKKLYPDVKYEIERFNGLPYLFDPKTGYMVFTNVTAGGVTHEMWLPVMDGANNAMLDRSYTYQVKKYDWNNKTKRKEFNGEYEEKTVEAATMFDINKAIMRCLTKNIAMFGLGLYIYAGEDLPETPNDFEPITEKELSEVWGVADVAKTIEWYERQLNIPFNEWGADECEAVRNVLKEQKEKEKRMELREKLISKLREKKVNVKTYAAEKGINESTTVEEFEKLLKEFEE